MHLLYTISLLGLFKEIITFKKRYTQGLRTHFNSPDPLTRTSFKFQIIMRKNFFLYCLFINFIFISATAHSQTVNFDETWREFLDNNKISNMSELVKPDKARDPKNYSKYLLMNTNSSFCQSEVEEAEDLMVQIQEIDGTIHESIPGFVPKLVDLETKIKAYHSIDETWKRFLQTKEVSLDELDAITATKTICEKKTLAKYSFMTAYHHFCEGNVVKAKDIFENRTLRLTEKTTLRVQDVEGLRAEVANMKSLFQDLSKLDRAWQSYVETGVSTGFNIDLPLFLCNPIPNMKIFVLKGAEDVCRSGPTMLANIRDLQAKSGVIPEGEFGEKVDELEMAIKKNEDAVAALNREWEAFLPNNKVGQMKYGYEFCSDEPLIRAYIMLGFAFPCNYAEDMLFKIDSIQSASSTPLERTTLIKIGELGEFYRQHHLNGENIDRIWNNFVAQGDVLTEDYQSTDEYCDYVQLVKDWTMRGLSGTCEEGIPYLEKIEEIKQSFDWVFYEELECRVKKLRYNVWNCRYEALQKLAQIEASPEDYEKRLQELMKEYGMDEEPEVCESN